MDNKRKLEKERRSKKCELDENVIDEIYRLLDEVEPQDKPKFAEKARFVAI